MLFSWYLQDGPQDFDFFNGHGADYSFDLISIETYAPQLIGHNKLFLGSVESKCLLKIRARYQACHVTLWLRLNYYTPKMWGNR